jgi:hypothetical protein
VNSDLRTLQIALDELRAGQMPAQAFSVRVRQLDALLTTLPPRYGEVLLGLLDRLESSALFTDESCSFSHHNLLDSVQLWLDKASVQLAPADPGKKITSV